MECRKSGLSDYGWCLSKGIASSTFYHWVKQLRKKACYEIPESNSQKADAIPTTMRQDVVKVNIIDDVVTDANEFNANIYKSHAKDRDAPIEIQMNGIYISIHNSADPILLGNTLKILKGLSC